jgi:hypothetical protein
MNNVCANCRRAVVEPSAQELLCWCGHYEREHVPGGYGEQATGGCSQCSCGGYTEQPAEQGTLV